MLRLLTSLAMAYGIKNKLFLNFFSLGIVQVITSLLQLLVIPYVIRHIGVEGFGVVAVAQVVMFYFSAITEYGFNQTATREISIERNKANIISKVFFRVLFSRILLCFISFLVLLVLVIFVPLFRQHSFLYLKGFVFVVGQTVLCNWFFAGIEKMQLLAVINLLARLIFVALVFIFLKTTTDAWLYLFFLGIGNSAMGLLSIFLVVSKYKVQFALPNRDEIANELRKGWQITLTNLSNNICQYANVFILRVFTNDLVTGYYSIAERIFLTIRQMTGVYLLAIYPQFCLVVDNGKAAVKSFFLKNYFPFFIAFVSGCLCLFILSPGIIFLFTKGQSGNAADLLRVFSIVLVIVCLNIPATVFLLGKDQRQTYFTIYAISVLINISLNVALASFFKSTGTVITIFLTELFLTVGLTRAMLRSKTWNRLEIGELLKTGASNV